MATHLREDTSAQSAADVCDAIASALDSDPETKPLAPLWDGLAAKGDALAAQRRKLNRAWGRSRARLAVTDARWDVETGAFGRAVVDATAGRRDRAPYTRFFADVTPSDAQGFGAEREVALGRKWIAELGREPTEPLAVAWAPRLSTVTDALDKAVRARAEAVTALGPQATAELLYLEAINLEIDKLEGELKKLFAGNPKRVASYLAVTKPRRRRAVTSEESDGGGDGDGSEA